MTTTKQKTRSENIPLKADAELHGWLKEAAARNYRTLIAEAAMRLRASFEAEHRAPKRKTARAA